MKIQINLKPFFLTTLSSDPESKRHRPRRGMAVAEPPKKYTTKYCGPKTIKEVDFMFFVNGSTRLGSASLIVMIDTQKKS